MAATFPRFIVTLVHGTFAKGARWVRPDGALGRALTERFGDAVKIESMEWSGSNHFEARREAAEKLRDHVLRSRPGLEGAPHVVIAHSHAGNVVSYAARDSAVDERIAAIVTLATPFIVARRRNLGWSGQVTAQALVLWLVLGIFYWILSKWGAGWTGGQQVAAFIGLALLVEIPMLFMAGRWAESSAAFLEQLGHAETLRERMLILRAVADEATGLITFFQFPSLLATLTLGNLAKLIDRYVRWCALLVKRPLWAICFCLAGWMAGLAPGFLVLWLTGSHLLLYITLIVGMCLSYGPMIFLWLRNPFLAWVTAAGPIALLAAPVVLVLGVTLLCFGPRFAMANLYLDLSVEATPIGDFHVHLSSPPAAANPDTPGGLLHSALYDDPAAVAMACDFIAERLRVSASGSPT